jgi:hypothetical protein
MSTSAKLAALCVLGNLPMLMAITFYLTSQPTQQEIFDSVSKYALAYEKAVDKEKYLETIYDEVKDIDEVVLPHDLKVFVIKVKVSQFGKLK